MSARLCRAAACLVLAALPQVATSQTEGGLEGPADEPGTDAWRFRVTLDDKPIGYHRFEVTRRDGTAEVSTEARFEVDVLFFTAYRYTHDNRETWRDDCLRRIRSTTDDNGERFEVDGSAGDDAFELERNDEVRTLEDDCVQSFAYWNPDILRADRLLNAQTGEVQTVRVEHLGRTTFELDEGIAVESDEYVIGTDDGDIRLWYQAGNGQWLGLETQAKGDRLLRYEPDTLPEPPTAKDRVAFRGEESSGSRTLPRP